jgi:hypothetical protein
MKEQKSNKANDIVVLSSKAKSISGPTPTKQARDFEAKTVWIPGIPSDC